MKGIRLLLAASAMLCVTHSVSAANMMKVKMAETYLKTAEAGGFTQRPPQRRPASVLTPSKKSSEKTIPMSRLWKNVF